MADRRMKYERESSGFTIEPVELVEVMDEFGRLLKKIEVYNPHVDVDLIKRSLRFAAIAHAGQRRLSGKPFIYHGIKTASILADLHLDSVVIACGVMHDVAEDTEVTVEDVREEFGDEIATIIEGLTKIAELKLRTPEEQQAENFRKMILYTAQDVRTILVKFADRLHNMRTLRYLPAAKRKRIAHETLEVFAPLAHRFGVNTIKSELENLSMRWLHPREYRDIKRSLKQVTETTGNYIEMFIDPIKERLREEGVDHVIQWRLKHIYSIFRKMRRRNVEVGDIYDVFAIRIIVNDVARCYHTLGIIHSMFTPVVWRIKDFIATPKFNMYQSLHTTVIGPGGRSIEVQIRTHEMHETAETGIAAHWRYKEGYQKPDETDSYMVWLRKVVDWQSGTPEASEFMHELKMDLFQDEVFVFTPKGDLIQLPRGSTPIDFAFALHTEIGLHCSGAKVNGRMVPLDTKLNSGQWVEVLTTPNHHPSPGWLNIVKTAKARSLVRRWIKRQHFNESRDLGLDMLGKLEKLRGAKISERERGELIRKFHQRDWDRFLAGLGSGDVSLHGLRNYLGLGPERKREKSTEHPRETIGVSVHGLENMMVSYANCCRPLPGDEIIGFVTRGRGLVVHRKDCTNIVHSPEVMERAINISWEPKDDTYFVASIQVQGRNRKNFLTDITGAISKANCNIRHAHIETTDDIAIDDFDVDVKDLGALENLMKEIRKVKGVGSVRRVDMRSPDNVQPYEEE